MAPAVFKTVVGREERPGCVRFARASAKQRNHRAAKVERETHVGGRIMDALVCMATRRSIRRYTEKPVEAEKVQVLLTAAMAAPSAGNQQP